jgi:lysozyme family protein
VSSFQPAIANSLKWEGGLVKLENDKGGITNFGISLKFLKSINPNATEQNIKNLTMQDAKLLLYKYFWLPNNYQDIKSQKIASKVFDIAINCGAYMANIFLQSATNLLDYSPPILEDGIIGPKSIAAINLCNQAALYDTLKYNAIAYYIALIVANKTQSVFKEGWLNRCCSDP